MHPSQRGSSSRWVPLRESWRQKLEERLSANDPASVWRGLQEITSYRRPVPTVEANKDLANELNTFYCRFETDRLPRLTLPSPETLLQTMTPNTPSTSPPSPSPSPIQSQRPPPPSPIQTQRPPPPSPFQTQRRPSPSPIQTQRPPSHLSPPFPPP
ncbi:lysine-rich arabinogalactan protein 19 [Oreochromis niloticus]|uniref:lysine-rich arabinogalactan protein 19 n=1 Tax=Oreochromis niloticus TaxID=8128 RepID=UPI000DF26F43|nr:lysine-rich arabinogalactan protein 19-like [Oreochromis niloticus]